MKWDMGWMHDTLEYMKLDPIHRKFHHDKLTFRMLYAFSENYVLPLSHDEVVHLKGSLLTKMPGDDWQRFANLRLLFAWMWAQPGKKLLFMGGEIAVWREWNHDSRARLGTPRRAAPRRHSEVGPRPEPSLLGRARPPRARLRARRVLLDRLRGLRAQRRLAPAARDVRGRRRGGRVQLHAAAAVRLPDRGTAARTLEGDRKQRRGRVRGQRRGQPRGVRGDGRSRARTPGLDGRDAPAARRGVLQAAGARERPSARSRRGKADKSPSPRPSPRAKVAVRAPHPGPLPGGERETRSLESLHHHPRPLLPAAAGEPVDGGNRRGGHRRARTTTGTSGSRRSATRRTGSVSRRTTRG